MNALSRNSCCLSVWCKRLDSIRHSRSPQMVWLFEGEIGLLWLATSHQFLQTTVRVPERPGAASSNPSSSSPNRTKSHLCKREFSGQILLSIHWEVECRENGGSTPDLLNKTNPNSKGKRISFEIGEFRGERSQAPSLLHTSMSKVEFGSLLIGSCQSVQTQTVPSNGPFD